MRPNRPRFPPGTVLHIISRGNRRQDIFESEEDFERFERFMAAEFAADSVEILGHCLMPNHVHIIVRIGSVQASAPMHRLLTSHAQYMNKKYSRSGHLFQGRFKTYPVEGTEGLKQLLRYVHRNPIRGRLVNAPGEWKWSSHRAYLDPESEGPSGKAFILSLFGADPASGREAYARFMEDSPSEDSREGSRLGAIAARLEREAGHRAGAIRDSSRARVLSGLRKRFILQAARAGFKQSAVAEFLGRHPATVSRVIQEAAPDENATSGSVP